jgi:hypothetical protein
VNRELQPAIDAAPDRLADYLEKRAPAWFEQFQPPRGDAAIVRADRGVSRGGEKQIKKKLASEVV